MKTRSTQNLKNIFFGLVTAFVLFSALNGFAQVNRLKDFTQHKYAYENLANAIKSNNDGVREDAIYLVGRYKLIDFENDLINQLNNEKDSDIKVLIGLALYRLESEKGMKKLLELSVRDSNERVRRMSAAIYNEYLLDNSNRTAAK